MNQPAAAPARPPAIEDPSNRWLIHPIADRLLPAAIRAGIAPNAVSIAGLACGILGGAAYYHWREPGAALIGLGFMLGWHIADGLDGKLARATGRTSALGRLIDGVCDYLVFFAVLIPLALSFADWHRMLALCLVAGAFHAAQAAWYEGEREAWRRRASGQFAPVVRPVAGSVFERFYNYFETTLGNRVRPVDRMLANDPARREPYLAATAPLLRAMAIAGANGRTAGIFVAVSVGRPWLYWYWEIVGVTLAALILAWRLRRREAVMVATAVASR